MTDDWIMEMWHVYTMELFSAVEKKNAIMKISGKWMVLEKIMLSTITQAWKDKYSFSHVDLNCESSVLCI